MPYKKNYLAHVIFQLQFPAVHALEQEAPAALLDKIKHVFPNMIPGQEIEAQITLGSAELKSQTQSIRPRYTFQKKDMTCSLVVSSSMLSLEYTKYHGIESTKQDFVTVWEPFQAIYKVKTLTRVGLRYIDKIVRPTGDPLKWDGWIAEPLMRATLAMDPPEGHSWARSMHALHWTGDDHRIAFQFGLFNGEEFPNPIAKKEFLLDTDCSSLGAVDASDATDCLVRYRNLLQAIFEKSIGDDMRQEMNS